MSNRIVTRSAGLLLAVFAVSCSDKGPTGPNTLPFEIKPVSVAVIQGEKTQMTLTGIAASEVTWESTNTAKATVDANGLVTTLDSGRVAISARSKADPTLLSSATVTIIQPSKPPVTFTNQSAATGAQLRYVVFVPAGKTELRIAMSGGTGDGDLHVRFGSPPTLSAFDCRPYLGGNNETCVITNPASGVWYIMIDAYTAFSGVRLAVTTTP